MRVLLAMMLAATTVGCDRSSSAQEESDLPVVAAAATTYDGATETVATARLAHGKRLSYILGCTGCHGDDLRGQNVTEKDPAMGDWWAPNITLHMPDYSDSDLDRVIRQGHPRDGRTFYFMPAESLQFVSDPDLAALTAYLRTIEPGGDQMPPVKKGPLFIELEQKGEFAPATEMIRRFRVERPADLGPGHALGRYIAMTVCSECHNAKLQGYEGFSPTLDTAGAYETAELDRLLTTGEGKTKKDLGLMSATARHRFAKFTPRERTAIIAYLKARAEQSP